MAAKKINYDTTKTIRISGEQYDRMTEILRKEGFTFSDAVRMLMDTTVKEGRIPRAVMEEEDESAEDQAKEREAYVDALLYDGGFGGSDPRIERLKKAIFGAEASEDMSAGQLREWGANWGLPEGLSVATLADLYDHSDLTENPCFGKLNAAIKPMTRTGKKETPDDTLETTLCIMEQTENLRMNLEEVKNKMYTRAVKLILEGKN